MKKRAQRCDAAPNGQPLLRLAKLISTLVLALPLTNFAEPAASPGSHVVPWEYEYTTSVLGSVGGGASPLNYVLLPQILSVLLPPHAQGEWAGGTLILRPRLSLVLEPIAKGPETHYVGFSAAGELEWRAPNHRDAFFFAAGGGAGLMDSRGYDVAGAQGQDLNFNWFVHGGVRVRLNATWRGSLGVLFQHLSNRNMDKVNPGINALGPTLGVSRSW